MLCLPETLYGRRGNCSWLRACVEIGLGIFELNWEAFGWIGKYIGTHVSVFRQCVSIAFFFIGFIRCLAAMIVLMHQDQTLTHSMERYRKRLILYKHKHPVHMLYLQRNGMRAHSSGDNYRESRREQRAKWESQTIVIWRKEYCIYSKWGYTRENIES